MTLPISDKSGVSPRILMCSPRHFNVSYVINPWMNGNMGAVAVDRARTQWDGLYDCLTKTAGASIELIEQADSLPDIVFTANAGIVRGGTCLLSRFRHSERRGEEALFADWFRQHGYRVVALDKGIAFEGAGDALFDESTPRADGRPLIWAAHGFRTDLDAHDALSSAFDADVVSLWLIIPRFYHLDTCFCPLPGGRYLWYPPAFDRNAQDIIRERIDIGDRYAVTDEEADAFTCNAVCCNGIVIMNQSEAVTSGGIGRWLAERSFRLQRLPLDEFMKAGGAAKCLTLKLD